MTLRMYICIILSRLSDYEIVGITEYQIVRRNIMELIKGRPADETGRLEKEIRVYDLLDKLGMEYYRTDHEPATTMEVCNDIDKILDTLICRIFLM